MAANPKTLRIVASRDIAPATRAIEIECVSGGAFDDVGGRYVIVHTGLTIGDKAIKRAYSLVPVAGAPGRAQLTVKRLAGGPGSTAVCALPVGTELTFSGPWGKLVPEGGLEPRTLLVATDTGITSALGIVARAAAGASGRPAEVLWLRAPDEDFLALEHVRERIEGSGVRLVTATIPPTGAPDRQAAAVPYIDARVDEIGPGSVIATGDGAVVHPLVDRLRGIDVRIECYFHNPEKKSAS